MLLKVSLLLMNGSCGVATAINYLNHFSDETDVADADADLAEGEEEEAATEDGESTGDDEKTNGDDEGDKLDEPREYKLTNFNFSTENLTLFILINNSTINHEI